MLLSRVLYNGVHCGDFIPVAEVPRFLAEVEALTSLHFRDGELESWIREFESRMRDLSGASLAVRKPIVF